MYQAAREAARTMAVQEATPAEAEAKANDLLAPFNISFTVEASTQSSDAVVSISVDKNEAAMGDPLRIFDDDDLTATVTMKIEQ